MTIEEFVSAEHNGSGAAKGCGYHYFTKPNRYEGSSYDCYTFCNTGYGCGNSYSDMICKGCGYGEARGIGNLSGKGIGCIRNENEL